MYHIYHTHTHQDLHRQQVKGLRRVGASLWVHYNSGGTSAVADDIDISERGREWWEASVSKAGRHGTPVHLCVVAGWVVGCVWVSGCGFGLTCNDVSDLSYMCVSYPYIIKQIEPNVRVKYSIP